MKRAGRTCHGSRRRRNLRPRCPTSVEFWERASDDRVRRRATVDDTGAAVRAHGEACGAEFHSGTHDSSPGNTERSTFRPLAHRHGPPWSLHTVRAVRDRGNVERVRRLHPSCGVWRRGEDRLAWQPGTRVTALAASCRPQQGVRAADGSNATRRGRAHRNGSNHVSFPRVVPDLVFAVSPAWPDLRVSRSDSPAPRKTPLSRPHAANGRPTGVQTNWRVATRAQHLRAELPVSVRPARAPLPNVRSSSRGRTSVVPRRSGTRRASTRPRGAIRHKSVSVIR